MRHLWMLGIGLLLELICLPVYAETLYGGATAVNLQPDTQQDVYTGQSTVDRTLPIYTGQSIIDRTLPIYSGQVNQAAYPPSPQQQELRAQTAKRSVRAALGFGYRTNSGLVYFVDQNCDLIGRIHPGDYLLALDGCNPNEVMNRKRNFGEAGTLMQCTFQTVSGRVTLPCTRHPVAFFGPEWQQGQR